MRIFIILTFCVLLAIPAAAQQARIESLTLIAVGTMERATEPVNDSTISTGTRFPGIDSPKVWLTKGSVIQARSGTVFGAEFQADGPNKGAKASVSVRWRYPEPGIAGKLIDELSETVTIGGTRTFFWTLGDKTLVPGIWTLELTQSGRLLAVQRFELRK